MSVSVQKELAADNEPKKLKKKGVVKVESDLTADLYSFVVIKILFTSGNPDKDDDDPLTEDSDGSKAVTLLVDMDAIIYEFI